MADDIIKNIKTEVEEIDCSINPEFIQLDFNIDDPPEITDQPLHLPHPTTTTTFGNFKCLACNLILPSKLEYDVHQQIHHSSPTQQNKRALKTTISYEECYDPECEDVDDPNYIPPSQRTIQKSINTTPKVKAVQAVQPLVNNTSLASLLAKPDKNYKCSKCFYLTENESLIREHMAKNKHSFKYQCNYCTKSFQFVYMLSNHHKSHHKDDEPCFDEFTVPIPKENDVFICSLCPHAEKRPSDIEKHHLQVHTQSSRPFSYYIQNIVTKSSKPALMSSKAMYQSKADFQDKSESYFIKSTNDYIHSGRPGRRPKFAVHSDSLSSKSDINELFYNCVSCDTWFKTLIDCKSHQERCHPSENFTLYISTCEGGPKLQEKSLTKYICIHCSEEAYTTSEIKMHCRIHKNASLPLQYIQLVPNEEPKFIEEATYKCSQCDVIPDTLMNMQKHWSEQHHNKVFKVMKLYADSPEKSYICKACSKIFKHPLMLDLHVKVKHSVEIENGVNPESLTKTAYTNSPKRNLNSSLSNMASSQITKPNMDIRAPLKVNQTSDAIGKVIIEKYQCLYCSQSYTFFDKLKEHHVGEHADFTWLYLYVRHMDNGSFDVVSSGDKLYKCFYCSGDFGKNFSALSIHYKDTHAPLQFKYKICEGKDGFSQWDVREQELKVSDSKENRKITQSKPSIPNPEKEYLKPDIPQLYVIPPQHQELQSMDDEILPDIKPDINYLNSLIDNSREENREDIKKRKLEEAYMALKKFKHDGNFVSWYRQKQEKFDLNRIVLLREFNNSTFKIAVSNIATVMNIQPKVIVKDYFEENK